IVKAGFKFRPFFYVFLGLFFYPLEYFIPGALYIGSLWGILSFVLFGANLWVKNMDYFYASAVGLFLWDIGAGFQGLIFSIPALPEPYGNSIPPSVVILVDSIAIIFTIILWIRRFEFKKLTLL
ncbi:MAG: hypothetical protein Q7K28_03510, partial [Candidatus Wildermuthbacteria bacterium]|nr:hypothetical protein [Candidatus Wildermuthbacteria bacterium]